MGVGEREQEMGKREAQFSSQSPSPDTQRKKCGMVQSERTCTLGQVVWRIALFLFALLEVVTVAPASNFYGD